MTIKKALVSFNLPQMETEILLAVVLNKDRSFINSFPEKVLTKTEELKFKASINRRRNHEPIPYIVGFKEFYGLKFLVNQNVLIPRPETENLVEEILNYCSKRKVKKLTVVDIGTGSGCIAISLAVNNPNIKIIATDVSPKALLVARKNAQLHRVKDRINFIQSNLLEKVTEKIDVIATNLPYIPTKIYKKLPREIRLYEPKLALDSGKSSTTIYEKLFKQVKSKLNNNVIVFYEIDGIINQVSLVNLVSG